MSVNSPDQDVLTLLQSNGFGTGGADLFSFQWGSDLDGIEVNKQICVTTDSYIDQIDRTVEQPVVNIMVRGGTDESQSDVYARARDIYDFMIKEPRQFIGLSQYVQFHPVGGLIPAGLDDNQRIVYSMSFYTFRQPTEETAP